jgi:hypothetical protein
MRSFTELTKLKVNTVIEAALEGPLGDQYASKPAKEPTNRPAPPKPSKVPFLDFSKSEEAITK